jgi:hypothetical protein
VLVGTRSPPQCGPLHEPRVAVASSPLLELDTAPIRKRPASKSSRPARRPLPASSIRERLAELYSEMPPAELDEAARQIRVRPNSAGDRVTLAVSRVGSGLFNGQYLPAALDRHKWPTEDEGRLQ